MRLTHLLSFHLEVVSKHVTIFKGSYDGIMLLIHLTFGDTILLRIGSDLALIVNAFSNVDFLQANQAKPGKHQ